jgi:GNAT superfamily N-acetyltransferase
MSTSAVTTNDETNARGAAITARDGFFFSLNDAYTSPGLIVATAAAEPAQERVQERAQAGTNGPVRHATPEDTAVIDTLLRAMGRESPIFRTMPIDDRKLVDYIGKVIRSNEHAVLLHEGPAGIDGIYIGMLVQQFFTFEITAMDILFYVRPERRGSRAAVRLFRAFKAWARSSGAKSIQVGTMTGIDPARTAKFYRGMGLNEIGGVYHGRAE